MTKDNNLKKTKTIGISSTFKKPRTSLLHILIQNTPRQKKTDII